MDLNERALKLHADHRGKIEIALKTKISNMEELSLAYTPGVAEPCRVIAKDPDAVFKYTNRGNFVAIVTDGTAILGLGDLGPVGGYPVMEGKAALFKAFADVDAIPICLNTTDVDEIVQTIINISPTFGGINLDFDGPTVMIAGHMDEVGAMVKALAIEISGSLCAIETTKEFLQQKGYYVFTFSSDDKSKDFIVSVRKYLSDLTEIDD